MPSAAADIMIAQEPSMLLERLGLSYTPCESRECSMLETRTLQSLLSGTGSSVLRPELHARMQASVSSSLKQSKLTPAELSKRWGIGLGTASATIRCSTQRGRRSVVNSSRRFQTKSHHFRYRTLPGKFYSDTLIGKVKSIRQFKCAQVTTNGLGYTRFLPIESKSEAQNGLIDFIHNAGIPE
jgi:hypothetical protein